MQDEQEIAVLIADDGDTQALSIYLRELRGIQVLTAEEELAVSRQVLSGDAAARAEIIRHNLRLVVKIARRYMGRGMALEDLIQEGNVGLIKTADRFNPDLGYRFTTYAVWWIREAIERAIINNRPVRLPIHKYRRFAKQLSVQYDLCEKLARDPTPQELAEATGFSLADVEEHNSWMAPMLSLDTAPGEDTPPMLELLVDGTESIEERLQQASTKKLLMECLDDLKPIHRDAVIQRFIGDKSVRQTAAEGGLTHQGARERLKWGLYHFRAALGKRGIDVSNLDEVF